MICVPAITIHDLMQQVHDARRRMVDTANKTARSVDNLDQALEPYRAAPDPHTALIEVLFNSRSLERDD